MSNGLEDLGERVAHLEAVLTRAAADSGMMSSRIETLEMVNGELNRRLEDSAFDQADMDVFWLIFGGIMVFWMQAGFAMLEVGTVHKKNTKNILIKNMFDAAIGALCWWWFGHALSGSGDSYTSTGNGGFAGDKGFAYVGSDRYAAKGKDEASFFFAWTFAGAAATIVSGAVAERCSFQAYLAYSAVLTSVVYPPVVHMLWGNGKFSANRKLGKNGGEGSLFMGCGLTDFAGSGVVHLTGGVAAFVGAAMIGPRMGRWAPDYRLPKGDPVLQSLGVFILWTGWYGFNATSTLAINGQSAVAAHICVTTTISASIGCLCCSLIGYVQNHVIDPGKVNNGVLAGLVAITAGCSVVTYAGAFCIGLVAGPLFLFVSAGMKKLGVDDVVDAVAVHGACGCWGVLSAALFATPGYYNMTYGERGTRCAGVFYGGSGAALVVALVCVGVVVSWVGSTMVLVFGALKMAGYLRVSAHVEEIGMDDSKHGGGIHHLDPDLDRTHVPSPTSPNTIMVGKSPIQSFKSVAPTSFAADENA